MKDLSPDAWNERYLTRDTPWDLSGPTPEFARLAKDGIFHGRVLVPGGGRGYDAALLAQAGCEVHLVDFAPAALEAAKAEATRTDAAVRFHCRDFFELPDLSEHRGRYDVILEYTFYCAVDPQLRPAYARAAADLLRPGGLLAALFFPTAMDKEGPPFIVSREEVERLFAPYFELRFEAPQASVKPRAGREFLGLFRRK